MDQEIKKALDKHEEHLKSCDEHFLEIDEKLKEHDEHFERIEAKLKEHDERFERIEAKLKEHDEQFEELKEIIRSIQRTLLIVEDAVTNKIPALFDGYKMHQEKQEELEERVDTLENSSEKHSIRISVLESVTSENSKQLAHLLS